MHVQGREPMGSLLSLILFLQANMPNLQLIKRQPESKLMLFAGIDVGSEELVLAVRKDGKPFDPQTFANTPSGRVQLVKKLIKQSGIIACLEATGVYHFDLAIALHDAGVLLMMVNPKASHKCAGTLVAIVVVLHIITPQLLHGFTQALFVVWSNKQMYMVGH